MEVWLSIAIGLGLAAACGFRIFVPMLIMSLASRTEHLALSEGFDWIASDFALVIFAIATVVEILAFYVPWIDNLLDTVAAPTAVIAGIIVTASAVQGMSPAFRWAVAIIAGGGISATVQAGTVLIRQISSLTTGGLANPVFSTAEATGAVAMSSLAIFSPFLAATAFLAVLFFAVRWILRRNRKPLSA